MEIKDNLLLRQFELQTQKGLLSIEYAIQERKLFLTRLSETIDLEPEMVDNFLKEIIAIATERKLKVVPTHGKIIAFFKKNPTYKTLLPPGIKI